MFPTYLLSDSITNIVRNSNNRWTGLVWRHSDRVEPTEGMSGAFVTFDSFRELIESIWKIAPCCTIPRLQWMRNRAPVLYQWVLNGLSAMCKLGRFERDLREVCWRESCNFLQAFWRGLHTAVRNVILIYMSGKAKFEIYLKVVTNFRGDFKNYRRTFNKS